MTRLFWVVMGVAGIALFPGGNAPAQQRAPRCDNPVPAYPVSAQTKLRDRAIRTLLIDATASFVRCIPESGIYVRVLLDFRFDGSVRTTYYAGSAAQGPWRLNRHPRAPQGTDIGTWQISGGRLCLGAVLAMPKSACFDVFAHQGSHYWKAVGDDILANGEFRIEARR